MTNVVPLRPPKSAFDDVPEQIVWECSCGTQRFFLHSHGGVECPECGVWQSGRWEESTPMGAD